MYHKIVVVGHLGGDPEMRYTPDGTPVTNFNMATTRKWGGDNPGEETIWFRVSVWRRQAETVNQYLSKGRLVLVEGSLTPDKTTGRPRIWTNQDGTAGTSYELRADIVRFLGSRGDSSYGGDTGSSMPSSPPSGIPTSTPTSSPSQPAPPSSDLNPITEDEIPF